MTDFDLLKKEVEDGIAGKNSGIPMGFRRLNNHVGIRKSVNYLIGGYTGSGKTSLVDDAFVLNPLEWVLSKQNETKQNMKVIYFSMERKKSFKLAKWISRRIFLNSGEIIPINRLMGWVAKENRLTLDEHDLFLMNEDYINAMMEKIDIIEGPQNPTGIRKYIDAYAKSVGEVKQLSEYKSLYVPNDPNLITIILKDHVGLQKKESGLSNKKEVIDKGSEDGRKFRDFYGFSCVDVSQFNRDIANPMRIKNGDVEPMLEDFKDSGSTQEDADVVFSLFDPIRYKVPDPTGYELERLRDADGKKFYRSLRILKNSYGSDDIRIGLAMQPVIGHFKEMPKKQDINESIYDSIRDNTYFINI